MKQGTIHITYREDSMSQNTNQKRPIDPRVTVEEVNRVLEVGRLLFSVLTDEEKEELGLLIKASSSEYKKGNAGVT